MLFLGIWTIQGKIRLDRPSDTWQSIGRCDRSIGRWPPLVYFSV